MEKSGEPSDDHALCKRCCLLQTAVARDPYFFHGLALVREPRAEAASAPTVSLLPFYSRKRAGATIERPYLRLSAAV
jgi:hypothetical protein